MSKFLRVFMRLFFSLVIVVFAVITLDFLEGIIKGLTGYDAWWFSMTVIFAWLFYLCWEQEYD
jgi:hypothetical protein